MQTRNINLWGNRECDKVDKEKCIALVRTEGARMESAKTAKKMYRNEVEGRRSGRPRT